MTSWSCFDASACGCLAKPSTLCSRMRKKAGCHPLRCWSNSVRSSSASATHAISPAASPLPPSAPSRRSTSSTGIIPRSIDRPLYEQLLTLDFLGRGENVLLRGQAGVGKTTLAQNLGLRALERGHTVRFSTLPAALADLLRQESLPATERRLKRYTFPDLLILDELGYVPCDSRAADLLFHIVSPRHEKRSVVLTTNLAYKKWGTVFHDASCLGALVDRFAQHCHTLDIDADSWRHKEALQRNRGKKPPPPDEA